MAEKEFNLLHEPWILVMNHDGTTEELSLLNVFRKAHTLHGLAGELATQDIAILRFLLAILHATFGRQDVEGNYHPISEQSGASPADARQRWKSLWDSKEFPYGVIEKYLLKYEDRFWLFHPERPFYQVAELNKVPTTSYESSKLNGEISESSNKVRLFPQRTGAKKSSLPYNEVARWLLYVNAFDDTSAKPKQPNLPSPGIGWLGKLGLIIAVGSNLFETLMLNFVLLPNGEKELWHEEKPIWEVGKTKSAERTEITMPRNASEILTLQSRRLLLKRKGDSVIGYDLLGGDFFSKENPQLEQMTVWKYIVKSGTTKPELTPKRHNPAQKLWRDFSSLVAQGEAKKRPGVIEWLAHLKTNHLLKNRHFRFQTASVHYGDKDFFVDDIFSDSISFNADLLEDLGINWVNAIVNEIKTTELLVNQLWVLKQGLAIAEGHSDLKTHEKLLRKQEKQVKAQAYFRLDAPFRQWLEGIVINDEPEETCEKWFVTAKEIIRNLGKELVTRCGPQSTIGHTITTNGKVIHYIAPDLFNHFLSKTKSREALEKPSKRR